MVPIGSRVTLGYHTRKFVGDSRRPYGRIGCPKRTLPDWLDHRIPGRAPSPLLVNQQSLYFALLYGLRGARDFNDAQPTDAMSR